VGALGFQLRSEIGALVERSDADCAFDAAPFDRAALRAESPKSAISGNARQWIGA
jgi:hypothetical protein